MQMSKPVNQSIYPKGRYLRALSNTRWPNAAIGLASLSAFWLLAAIPTGRVLAQDLPQLSDDPVFGDIPEAGDGPLQPLPQQPLPAAQRGGILPSIERQNIPLSPGDLLRLQIPGVGGEEFSGEYVVNYSGSLEIPLLDPLPVLGLSPTQVESRLTDSLIQRGLFRPGLVNVSIQVLDYSPIQVAVAGEVFEPGRILLSNESASGALGAQTQGIAGTSVGVNAATPGDYPLERYLTSAIKAIGGVRPTADVTQVQVIRGTESTVVDLSALFLGGTITDFPLISGDQVIVPSAGRFQEILVQPSQITPDSVELYVSNVTEGSNNNIDRNAGINSASFKYGTNLTQALVAAQCVGGTPSTNANRRALLIQTDSLTGALKTAEYSVNDLVSDDTKSAERNPFLMPEDAIACYDSRNTNIRGILGTVTDFLNPFNLLFNIFN